MQDICSTDGFLRGYPLPYSEGRSHPPEVSAGSRRSSLQYFRSGKPAFCPRCAASATPPPFLFRFHRGKRALLRQRMTAFLFSVSAAVPFQAVRLRRFLPHSRLQSAADFRRTQPEDPLFLLSSFCLSVGRNNGTCKRGSPFP